MPFQWLGLVARIAGEAGGDLVHFTVSFWLMLPVSALVAAFFGMLFGAPTLRLKGDYLAIVTLGFGEIVPIVARNTPDLTNGAMGLNGVAAPQLFGWSFGVDATALLLCRAGDGRLADLRQPAGSRIRASGAPGWRSARTRSPPGRWASTGSKLKLLAFAIGAAFAGATGTFYVAKLQTATPEMFSSRSR